jgi:hypothetical protein
LRKVLTVLALVLVPGLAMAATPSEGVALQVRRGFFTETDVGMFLTAGGGNNSYSNAQTYLQLGVGYDVSENIELGFNFGMGTNAANCWGGTDKTGNCLTSDNFTVSFLDVTAAYLVRAMDRFYISPKLAGGYTLMGPAPVKDSITGKDIGSGVNIGGGVGFEYATHMDHFSIGADVLARYIVGPNIPTFTFFPRVKYTF